MLSYQTVWYGLTLLIHGAGGMGSDFMRYSGIMGLLGVQPNVASLYLLGAAKCPGVRGEQTNCVTNCVLITRLVVCPFILTVLVLPSFEPYVRLN